VTFYRFTDRLPADFGAQRLRDDARAGLAVAPRELPSSWLYDKVGSDLFEAITQLPEYYPARCEQGILERHAHEAVSLSSASTLVELGSGSSLKTQLLLDALTASVTRPSYVAVDVSEDALRQACSRLADRYPSLDIEAVRADFGAADGMSSTQSGIGSGPVLVAFLGSTIGNLDPSSRATFLAALHSSLSSGDHLLLGADLVKSPEILIPAYDDSAGVTAAFNLNVLDVLNRALDGDFSREDFRHRAVWNVDEAWIEMRLEAVRDTTITLKAADLQFSLSTGDSIRTEISTKFRRSDLSAELDTAGFSPIRWWTDQADLYSLSLWARR
jgi:L-histidine N-alpha-methyltransferase